MCCIFSHFGKGKNLQKEIPRDAGDWHTCQITINRFEKSWRFFIFKILPSDTLSSKKIRPKRTKPFGRYQGDIGGYGGYPAV